MSGPVRPPLTVTTASGTPSGRPITTIKVSNGDLTVSGNVATIDTSGSGGTPGGSTTEIQYNNAGAFAGDAGFVISTAGGGSSTLVDIGGMRYGGTGYGAQAITLNGTVSLVADGTGQVVLRGAEDGGGTWTDTIANVMSNANADVATLRLRNNAGTYKQANISLDGSSDLILENSTTNADIDLKVLGTGQVEVENQTTDNDTTLSVKGNGTGDAVINLNNPSKAISLICDTNQKLKVQGGVNTFVFDASSATGGITWPDGTTQITAASGGTPAGSDTEVQFNNSGAFGASSNLTWTSSNQLQINGTAGGTRALTVQGNLAEPAASIQAQTAGTTTSQAGLALSTGLTTGSRAAGFGTGIEFRAGDLGFAGYLAGTIKTEWIDSDSNHNLLLSAAGTGSIRINDEYTLPAAVTGTNDYVLTAQTDGSTAWAAAGGGGGVNFPLPLGALDSTYKYLNIGTAAPYGINTGSVAAKEADYALNTRPRAFPFIAPASAAPVSMSVIQDTTGTGTATIGIYSSNSDNYPATLVATGTYDPTSTGTRTATNSLSTALVGGELYYFCVRCDNNGGNLDAINMAYIPSIFPAWRINEDDENTCLDMNNITSGTALPATAAFGSGNSQDSNRPQMWLEF